MSTIRSVLNTALYNSINDREANPIQPDGADINMALDYLINALDEYREIIPYWLEETIIGTDNLLATQYEEVSYVMYYWGTVKYSLQQKSQADFNDKIALDTLQARPRMFYFERATHNIYVYPNPIDAVTAKFKIGYQPTVPFTSLDVSFSETVSPLMEKLLYLQVACDIAHEKNLSQSKINNLTNRVNEVRSNLEKNREVNFMPKKFMRLSNRTNGKLRFPWFYFANQGN